MTLRGLIARRRDSNGWLYFCLLLCWALIFGGAGLWAWFDARLGLAVVAGGLFVLLFEVGLLEAGRAAWLGMRLASLAGDRADRRREARKSGRLG